MAIVVVRHNRRQSSRSRSNNSISSKSSALVVRVTVGIATAAEAAAALVACVTPYHRPLESFERFSSTARASLRVAVLRLILSARASLFVGLNMFLTEGMTGLVCARPTPIFFRVAFDGDRPPVASSADDVYVIY